MALRSLSCPFMQLEDARLGLGESGGGKTQVFDPLDWIP